MRAEETVIEEIRETRCRIPQECGHYPERYVQYLKQFSRKFPAQVEKYEAARGQRFAGGAPTDR